MDIHTNSLNDEQIIRLLTALVAPRPIAWISTKSESGQVNLAPFSSFAPVANCPPIVIFSAGRRTNGQHKDTILNILSTGDFVINVVEENLLRNMIETADEVPPNVDEMALSKLTPTPSSFVKPPRIAECRAGLECRIFKHIELDATDIIFGEVLCVWVDPGILDHDLQPSLKLGFSPVGALEVDQYIVTSGNCLRNIPFSPYARQECLDERHSSCIK